MIEDPSPGANDTPRLKLRLFGVFTYEGEGVSGDHLKSRKAEALLLCLALSGDDGFEREHLSRMLWPDSPDNKAKAGLRQALARIRRAFGEVFDTPRAGWVSLAPRAVQCDLWDIEIACANADTDFSDWPTEPFLVNYPVINDIFSEWTERTGAAQKQSLKVQILRALGDPDYGTEKGVGFAQTLMLIDSVDEEAVIGVLDFLRASGRISQYMTVLQSYKSRLKSHYDLEPSAGFLEAYDHRPGAPLEMESESPAALPGKISVHYGKPVLSVAPFEVLGDAEDLNYLGIGIAEEIVAQISSQDWFSVSTPDSSPLYRTADVGHHKPHLLFNSYAMSGTVIKRDGDVQVSIRLVDESNSSVIWSRQLKASEDDILGLRSGLAASFSELLTSQVIDREASGAFAVDLDGKEDHWVKTMQARYLFWRMSQKNNKKARQLVDEVCTDCATPSAPAFVIAVFTRLLDVWSLWTDRAETDLADAVSLAERAVRIHPTEPWTHFALGTALGVSGHLRAAVSTLDRALSINPNFAAALGTKGKYQVFLGDLSNAKQNLSAAMQLNELDTHFGLWQNAMGIALYFEKDFERALKWSELAISTNRYWAHNYLLSAACHWHLGEVGQARRKFAIGQDNLGQPRRSELKSSFPFRDEELSNAWFEPLIKLGLTG